MRAWKWMSRKTKYSQLLCTKEKNKITCVVTYENESPKNTPPPPISDKMVVPLFFLVCLIYMHLIEIFHEGTIYQYTAIKMWQTQSTSLFTFLRRFLSCCFQSCFWYMPYRYYNIMNIYNLCCLNKPKDGETRYHVQL